MLLILIGMGFCVKRIIRQRQEGTVYIGGIILYPGTIEPNYIAPAPPHTIIALGEAAQQAGSIIQQAQGVAGRKPVVPFGLFESRAHKLTLIEGRSAIASMALRLAEERTESSRPKLQELVLLTAALLGLLAAKHIMVIRSFIFASASITSLSTVLNHCPTCEESSRLMGIDIGVVGFALFAILAFSALLPKLRQLDRLGPLLLLVSGVIQLALFANALTTCYSCLVVLFFTGLIQGASVIERPSQERSKTSTLLRCVAVAALVAPVVTFAISSGQIERHLPIVAGKKVGRVGQNPSFIGVAVSKLKLTKQGHPADLRGPLLLTFGYDTCPAGRLSLQWCAEQGACNYLRVRPVGEDGSEAGYVWNPADLPVPSPTILLVDSKGFVRDELFGWAEEREFKHALEQRSMEDLKRLKE